jgi:hypothetical protein
MNVLDFLSSLLWPAVVLIIIFLFREQIAVLIDNIKKIKVAGYELEIGDTVQAYSPIDKVYYSIPLKPAPVAAEKVEAAKISKLSDEEVEKSRQTALKRLEDDIKLAGYQRGKLFQRDDGSWAIAWEEKITEKIGVKDSTKI